MSIYSACCIILSYMDLLYKTYVLCDVDNAKEFILCEYNRDADSYRYYEGGISSVYLWKMMTMKYAHGKRGYLHEGGWYAIHVIQRTGVEDGHLCNMGKMIEELEGKLRNQLDQDCFLCTADVAIPGVLWKTKEMVCTLRPPSELLLLWPYLRPENRNICRLFIVKLSFSFYVVVFEYISLDAK
ncbi:putative F-actin-capping protein subunit beta [Helianthus annuus]|nr:putative F-actin-capping protein subunit beta [Helianthus annuus]